MKKQTKWGSWCQCYFRGIGKKTTQDCEFWHILLGFFSVKSVFSLYRLYFECLIRSTSQDVVSVSEFYLWEEKQRQISEQTCRFKLYSKFSLYSSVLDASISLKMTNYFSPPASPSFIPANQWLICMSSLLFWFSFILY